jgi:hypothetical protein
MYKVAIAATGFLPSAQAALLLFFKLFARAARRDFFDTVAKTENKRLQPAFC